MQGFVFLTGLWVLRVGTLISLCPQRCAEWLVSVSCWNAGAWDMAGFSRCASGSLCRLPGSQNKPGSVPLACSFHLIFLRGI